jgi:hypothetical protein
MEPVRVWGIFDIDLEDWRGHWFLDRAEAMFAAEGSHSWEAHEMPDHKVATIPEAAAAALALAKLRRAYLLLERAMEE